MLVQHAGEAGAGGASQRTADSVYPAPPGIFPAVTLEVNPHQNSKSDSSTRVGRAPPGLQSLAGLGCRDSNAQPDNTIQSSRARPVYTCEDCGMQFKDAPSRNKHQILIHYISENSEDDDGRSKTTQNDGDNVGDYSK